jgi:hypothetical protein
MSDPFWTGIWSGIAGSTIVAAIVGFSLKWYFGPYLSEKAKNLATHEDIQKLIDQVRETEQIKADIGNRIWHRQERWTYKRDLYIRLVESMTSLLALAARYRASEDLRRPDQAALREWGTELTNLIKLAGIGSFVLFERSNKILENFRNTLDADDPWSEDQIERLKAHLQLLRVAAREDLGYSDPPDIVNGPLATTIRKNATDHPSTF